MNWKKPAKQWVPVGRGYMEYKRTDYKIENYKPMPRKHKPLLRSQKILIALLLMLLAVITCTALCSCNKHTAPVIIIDGWYIHSDVPIDTCGMGR